MEWFLTLQELPLEHAHKLIDSPNPRLIHKALNIAHNTTTPALYDTGLDATAELWHSSGWAGRT